MTEPTWPNATQCFNCGTMEKVHRDIGLCESCRVAFIEEEHGIVETYRTQAKPHWEAAERLEQERDDAIDALLDKYKIPENFRR